MYPETDRDTLLNGLTTTSYWSGLANGISGATVTGSPTIELLMNSYNTKNGTNLVYTDLPSFDSSAADYDLYVPHTSVLEDWHRYWSTSPNVNNNYGVWYGNKVSNYGYRYNATNQGVRTVVFLPSSIQATKDGDVWTIAE